MVLAANFPLPSEGSGCLLGGRGWGTGSVPPQGQVQRLFGKQRLNQVQVQARHTAAVQHQDLVAGAQTCEEKTRLSGTGENTGGVVTRCNRQEADTFIKSQAVWKNFIDTNPAVFLAVYVSRYRKA